MQLGKGRKGAADFLESLRAEGENVQVRAHTHLGSSQACRCGTDMSQQCCSQLCKAEQSHSRQQQMHWAAQCSRQQAEGEPSTGN